MSQAIKATIKKLEEEDESNSDYCPNSESTGDDDTVFDFSITEQISKVEDIVNEFKREFQELKTLVQLITPEDTFLLHRDDDE